MPKSLVIVESPAKAKTIYKYLGASYIVKASMGHVVDLPSKGLNVDIENRFEPTYSVMDKKGNVIKELKEAAKGAEKIFLATDPDREGEAIAWHLRDLLGGKRSANRFHRVEFHEITPTAIRAAFAQPRNVDENLFNSQQARRVLDRIVGYQISPLLWRRLHGARSAGRVQSVAVRLIVDREREIRAFKPQEYWSVEAELRKQTNPATQFHARLARIGEEKLIDVEKSQFLLRDQATADAAKKELEGAAWKVEKIDEQPRKRNPFPPFMTSTLQRAAATNLNFGTEQTMRISQQLYEGAEVGDEGAVGLITYMRTDALTVSKDAQAECLGYIREKFGAEFAPETPNVYKSRQSAQGAHEAIRPTSVRRTPESVARYLDRQQLALYTLIWKRFVASQMRAAETLIKSVDILARNDKVAKPRDFWFRASSTQITFAGFLKVYGVEEGEDDKMAEEVSEPIPPLTVAEMLDLLGLKPEQHFTEPPPRYSEATLVKALEELGIGRPSTYAPTVYTIQKRKYVEKEKGRLRPTDVGEKTTDLLVEKFPNLMDVKFTAQMEEQLDEIESGKVEWHELLQKFYDDFKPMLDTALALKKEKTDLKCPECKKGMLVITEGRKGEYVACSRYPKCKFSSDYRRDAKGAIELVEQEPTGVICVQCQSPMVLRQGKRGEFLACSAYPKCKTTSNFIRNAEGKIEMKAEESTGQVCDKCNSPMVIRSGKRGEFLACSAYPKCKNAKSFTKDETGKITVIEKPAPVDSGQKCEKCGSAMVIRTGKRGPFLACSGFPKCRNAKPLPDNLKDMAPAAPPKPAPVETDEKCENCGKPMMIRQSARGPFLGCSGYPKCKTARPLPENLNVGVASTPRPTEATPSATAKPAAEPTGETCEKCGAPMVKRRGKFGEFLACSAYPKCKSTKKIEAA